MGRSARGEAAVVVMALVLLVLAGVLFQAQAEAQEWNYRVRPGDTIWDLSADLLQPGIGWQQLRSHNDVRNPRHLPPGSILRIPVAWLLNQPAGVRVVAVHGQAIVTDPGGPGTGSVPVAEGMELASGAVLRTAPEANLGLEFADGSRLNLAADSELILDRVSRFGRRGMVDTQLRLQRGRINSEVRSSSGGFPSFVVDTPNSSSAVRGTDFRVNATDAQTNTEVLSGLVGVASGVAAAGVAAGFGVAAVTGQTGSLEQVRLLPAPDLSDLPDRVHSTATELTWPALDGATGYRVEVAASEDFEVLLADRMISEPVVGLPALPDGHYYVRIRGLDTLGLEGADGHARFEVELLPDPPLVMAPRQDGRVREPQPHFRWAQLADAAGYLVEVADEAGFANPLFSGEPVTGGDLRLPVSLEPGRYYWRIATVGRDKRGLYSDPVAFTLAPLESVDSVGMDEDDADRGTTFRWREGRPGQSYRFQLSRSPTFDRVYLDRHVADAEITVPRLGSGTWYLRTQTIDVDGFEGPFPAAQRIELPCRWCKTVTASTLFLILLAL